MTKKVKEVREITINPDGWQNEEKEEQQKLPSIIVICSLTISAITLIITTIRVVLSLTK